MNALRLFFRSFFKQPGYSFLHIFGLALGIAAFIFISLYIVDELSFDRYHSKSDRIFRLHQVFESEGLGEKAASLPFPILEPLLNDYDAEIESYCRFFNFQAPTLALSTNDNQKEFNEPRVFFADSTLFDVFDFDLIEGDKKTALRDQNTMLITQSMARKYFPEESAVGKTLRLQQNMNVLITGVIADTPHNSHFYFDFLISFTTAKQFYASGNYPTNWSWNPVWTYIVFKDKNVVAKIEKGLPEFVKKYYPQSYHESVTLNFFPLTDIHLESHLDYEVGPNNSVGTLYILAAIAAFVLLIACINFINLSTARASKRAKEVGMRKTLGSSRIGLVRQFLLESIAMTWLGFIIAIIIVVSLLPSFNALAEKHISIMSIVNPVSMIALLLFPLVLGIIAGVYPAFVLSAFKPLSVMRSTSANYSRGTLHRSLVIVQFTLSIVLIIGTGVVFDQLNVLRKTSPGFEKDNVVLIPVMRTALTNSIFETLKDEMLTNPSVIGVTAVEDIIGSKHQVYSYQFEGLTEPKPFPALQVRHDFAKTFNVQMAAGRDYDETFLRDDSLGLVVNEELVRSMGWRTPQEAIGKKFDERSDRVIVGVIKDFNFTSRHAPIRPLVLDLVMHPASFNVFIKYIAVRIDPKQRSSALAHIKSKWDVLRAGWPFEYFYLGSNLDQLYKSEEKLSAITLIFAGLAIVVASLGLFGLATFTAEQRNKEMSIRKVLGSSGREIFTLFIRSFLVQVTFAALAAMPLAWFTLKWWLGNFAYQTEINFKWFAMGSLLAFSVAWITISYHAWAVSGSNPANVLRSE